METIIQNLERYFYDVLGIKIKTEAWKEEVILPFFLRELYAFYETIFRGKLFVFVIGRNETESTPATVSKHFKQLQEKCPALYIYVRPTSSTYNRKRLIERKIPFVIPGNQMYLPNLAMDLREHFLKPTAKKISINPATQAVIIYALTHKLGCRFIPSELAQELHYTVMTMSRALRELETNGIGKIVQKGRERELIFTKDSQGLWELVRPFMRNPIKKTVWIHTNTELDATIQNVGVISGLAALSHYSMLQPPQLPTYSIGIEIWKNLLNSNMVTEHTVNKFSSLENLDFSLEIWSYNPKLFAKDNFTDPFSLYLSLKDNPDDRVQITLEQMMRQIEW